MQANSVPGLIFALDHDVEMNIVQRIAIALRDITEFHAAYPAWGKSVTAGLSRKPLRYERLGKFQEKREKDDQAGGQPRQP
jgi:hypothetical protein